MPKTIEVKKIEVIPTALTLSVVAAIVGFIYAVLLAIGFGTLGTLSGIGMEGMMGMTGFGAAMIIILPIGFFIYTFIATVICAVVYNFVAERIGGIKFVS